MKFETEYLLQEFREEQSDLFGEDGRAYRMLTHQEPMDRMLALINALELEVNNPAIREIQRSANTILELSTGNGRLKEGQFVTYKGDEDVNVYRILDTETIQAFYPSEDGGLIEIKISELLF